MRFQSKYGDIYCSTGICCSKSVFPFLPVYHIWLSSCQFSRKGIWFRSPITDGIPDAYRCFYRCRYRTMFTDLVNSKNCDPSSESIILILCRPGFFMRFDLFSANLLTWRFDAVLEISRHDFLTLAWQLFSCFQWLWRLDDGWWRSGSIVSSFATSWILVDCVFCDGCDGKNGILLI